MTPYLAREAYGAGLAHGVDLIAQAFAQQFGVTLSGQPPPPPPPLPPADDSGRLPIPLSWLIGAAVLLIILTRGRVLLLPFYFGATFGGSGGGGGSGAGGGRGLGGRGRARGWAGRGGRGGGLWAG